MEAKMMEAKTMGKIWANSGDSHMLEPADLWQNGLPSKMAQRMPWTEKKKYSEIVHVDGKSFERRLPAPPREGEFFFHDGLKSLDGMTLQELSGSEAPGARDVRLRLKDLDDEGIWGEITYPSIGLWNGLIKDPVLYREGVKVMNDWLKETVIDVTSRIIPAAEVSILSVEDAVSETIRVAEMGFKAISLPTLLDDDVPNWNDDLWEPLWATADEAKIVLAFHIGSEAKAPDETNRKFSGPGGAVLNYVETTFGGQRAAVMMVTSGALDRHPNLKMLVSEGGATWAPFIADRMDEGYRQHGMYVRPVLSRPPSQILYDQVYSSFQHDKSAVLAYTAIGYRNVLFGSDYPHMEGTFGHTQKTLHELFDGVDAEATYRMTQGVFLDLFPSVGKVGVGETTKSSSSTS
jgi:predicted TIM-barrel fold metal-dependent hydrolase